MNPEPLFAVAPFTDFGPDLLHPPHQSPTVHIIEGPGPNVLRGRVCDECPELPGVYGMLDRHGDVIYLGKAKCLRGRLLSYFRPRSRDARSSRIIDHTLTLAWEVSPSEFAALHRELALIRRWRPRFNVLGQPSGWRYRYVCLGRRPAPYVFLANRPPAGCLASFGPVSSGHHAREAVRRLNDLFRLRDCPQAQEMVFADQNELFPVERSPGCLRLEIGTCLGPCAAACSRTDYAAQVTAARAFLAGSDSTLLAELHHQMEAASAAQDYERAATLRDRLGPLSWLRGQLDALRQARTYGSFVYPVTGHDGSVVWYLIHGGRTAAAVPEPADGASRQTVGALLRSLYQAQGAEIRSEMADKVEGVLLVTGWFHRYPEEPQRVLSPAEARGRCQAEAINQDR
ncbi:MAG: UvrB/UvrC motif-containing protein [Gemmataceae bacterium]|nr:UvrB/UvrC motif-containing protein [Gemmataceae bacterium]